MTAFARVHGPEALTTSSKPELCNFLAIRKAGRHIGQLYDRALATTGLSGTQFSLLARLGRLGPRTINELAAELVTDRTTMGRNLRVLERESLVAIGADASDRRVRTVSLTPQGSERLRQARAAWADAQARFEDVFGSDRAVELRRLLAEVVASDLGFHSND